MARPAALTADTITDEQIKGLLRDLPTNHHARQWCVDAVSWSASHPHRRRNARQQCAEILAARAKEAK